MGRVKLSVENIRRHTYVCEDHFDEGVVLDYCLVGYHKSVDLEFGYSEKATKFEKKS